MLQLKVPFYPNTPDNMHCFQAGLKSVLKYFIPEREFSWPELNKLTAQEGNYWTWPTAALINLRKMGFEVINMEDFDYKKFSDVGEEYLVEKSGSTIGKIQARNSNMDQEMRLAKTFLEVFGEQKTTPDIKDIKNLLEKEYLVACTLNGYALDGKKGFVGHFVVITGFDEDNLYLHNPGLPPDENRKVPNELFLKAWAYPNDSVKSLQAFKYSE